MCSLGDKKPSDPEPVSEDPELDELFMEIDGWVIDISPGISPTKSDPPIDVREGE